MAIRAKTKKEQQRHEAKPRIEVIRHKDTSTADIIWNAFESGVKGQDTTSSTPTNKYFRYSGKPIEFLYRELQARFAPKIEELILSVENNPITIAISSNGYGKTHSAAHIGTYWLCCHDESQVWTTMPQPEENLKRLLWGEIGLIVQRHPELFEGFERVSLPGMEIQREPKSGMYGVTIPGAGSEESRESRFSGKHAPFILFIVDEADGVPDEIFRAIEGCLSGGIARLLCMFNPKMETGAVYNFIKNKQANVINLNALEHPNVVKGKDIYPGAVTRDTTVRRIWNWTEPISPDDDEIGDDCFTVPNYLIGHVAPRTDGGTYPPLTAGIRRITDPQFSYAVLAQYPTMAEGQLIDKAKINAAVNRWKAYHEKYSGLIDGLPQPAPHIYVRPEAGLDIAETTDDNALALRYDKYVAPIIIWRGINVPTTSRKAAGICLKRNAKGCNTDANGLGASAHILMQEAGFNEAYGIKVTWSPTDKDEDFGEFDSFGDQGWWLLRQFIHSPDSMIPDDPKLIEELKIQMYWKTKRGKIKVHSADYFREKLKRSPDRSISLVLSLLPHPVEDEPGELFIDSYLYSKEEWGETSNSGVLAWR